MTISLLKKLEEFLITFSYFDLQRIIKTSWTAEDLSNHYLPIRVIDLFDWDPDLGEECLMKPEKFEEAFLEALPLALKQLKPAECEGVNEGIKKIASRAFIRFTGLPLTPWTFFERIPSSESLGRLISIRGTIVRTGAIKMQESGKEWECNRCRFRQRTEADDQLYGNVPKPSFCPGKIDDETPCKGTKFEEAEEAGLREGRTAADSLGLSAIVAQHHVDYQEIKIQELTSVLEIGAVPRSVLVLLRQEDLVDSFRAGEDVVISGILGFRCRPNSTNLEGELFLRATWIQPSIPGIGSDRRHQAESGRLMHQRKLFEGFWQDIRSSRSEASLWRARSEIVEAFCPHLHGMFLVKLATLMTVIGGSCMISEGGDVATTVSDEGARLGRREGHLLLVGDPGKAKELVSNSSWPSSLLSLLGTGKSQFLVRAARLISRSVLITGSGSTSAGLTAAAIKDGTDWQLEAGALVMADRGICCIDEFSSLKRADRTAIHEAMEQQTISIAKAGLVCKLNTRCSVIAACNASAGSIEGEDGERPSKGSGPGATGPCISANVALSSPLLSRFDLILILLDDAGRHYSSQWDSDLCDSLLGISTATVAATTAWDEERLRLYVNFVREEFNPQLTTQAAQLLSRYYQLQRARDCRHSARTTVRCLEALLRLSQSHAKLMAQDQVLPRDALVAILLMEASLTATRLLPQLSLDLRAAGPEDYAAYSESMGALLQQLFHTLDIDASEFEGDGMDSESQSCDVDALLALATSTCTSSHSTSG